MLLIIVKIELLYNKACKNWEKTLEVLKQVVSQEIKVIEIRSEKDVIKHSFHGAPQINIDGKDIDPESDTLPVANFSVCRAYYYKNKLYSYMPKEMIIEVLSRSKVN